MKLTEVKLDALCTYNGALHKIVGITKHLLVTIQPLKANNTGVIYVKAEHLAPPELPPIAVLQDTLFMNYLDIYFSQGDLSVGEEIVLGGNTYLVINICHSPHSPNLAKRAVFVNSFYSITKKTTVSYS